MKRILPSTYLKSQLLISMFVLGFAHVALSQSIPRPDHIIVIIEENKADTSIIGNMGAAPYINAFVNDTNSVSFSQAFAIEHPSQPNYLDLFSGSNQGVINDNVPANYPFTTPNLARQLLDNGLSFATYSQDLPLAGFDGAVSGQYARKHNPVTNWVGTGTNQVPDSLNQPFTALPTDLSQLPTVSYLVANLDSDMHNGFGNAAIAPGDTWFHNHIDPLLPWALTHNTLVIFTFDEDEGFGLTPNNIPTVFFGPMVKGGTDTNHIDLYSILRTMEDMYGLPYAGNASTASPITSCWKAVATGINGQVTSTFSLQAFPNPSSSRCVFKLHSNVDADYKCAITDAVGRVVTILSLVPNGTTAVSTLDYPNVFYSYHLLKNGLLVESGKLMVMH
jgi:hypothetical protein